MNETVFSNHNSKHMCSNSGSHLTQYIFFSGFFKGSFYGIAFLFGDWVLIVPKKRIFKEIRLVKYNNLKQIGQWLWLSNF